MNTKRLKEREVETQRQVLAVCLGWVRRQRDRRYVARPKSGRPRARRTRSR